MKNSARNLLICGVLFLIGVIGLIAVDFMAQIGLIEGDAVVKPAKAFCFYLTAFSYIACLVGTVWCAKEKRFNIFNWTLGTFLMPFATPLKLVFADARINQKKGQFVSKSLFGNGLSLCGNKLTITRFGGMELSFEMDKLRFIFALIPGKFWTVLVHSSQKRSCVDLDGLSDEEFATFNDRIQTLMRDGGFMSSLGEYIICLADYNHNYAQLTLKQIKASGINFLGVLSQTRQQRLSSRRDWLQHDAYIVMHGTLWNKAVLNLEGFRKGRRFIRWDDVEIVHTLVQNGMIARIYPVPRRSKKLFGPGKYKYGMLIPVKKVDIYTAECIFWRSLTKKKESYA
jgi:hypothetical protein